jgi:hypothetical protein
LVRLLRLLRLLLLVLLLLVVLLLLLLMGGSVAVRRMSHPTPSVLPCPGSQDTHSRASSNTVHLASCAT